MVDLLIFKFEIIVYPHFLKNDKIFVFKYRTICVYFLNMQSQITSQCIHSHLAAYQIFKLFYFNVESRLSIYVLWMHALFSGFLVQVITIQKFLSKIEDILVIKILGGKRLSCEL